MRIAAVALASCVVLACSGTASIDPNAAPGVDDAGEGGGGEGRGGADASGGDDAASGADVEPGDAGGPDAPVTDAAGGDDVAMPDAGDASTSDTATAEDAAPDAPPFGGAPEITRVYPEVVLSDGLFYVEGERLARLPNDVRETRVQILPEVGDPIEARVVAGVPGRVVVSAPADLHERLPGLGTVVLTTPEGGDTWQPVFATNDSTFSGKTLPGAGFVGNVYRLVEGAPQLPDLDAPCGDAVVRTDTGCPFTSILVGAVNIPERSWDAGFPGLLADVQEWFAIRFDGYLEITTPGEYGFRTCSDDGSTFEVDSGSGLAVVVDNDGTHSMQCREGTVTLDAGRHAARLGYYQGPRTEIGMVLSWRPPGGDWAVIPEEALRLFELDAF